jgi:putative flippase GtrA
MRTVQRWARFNAVGAAGFMVQTLAVWLLADRGGMHYLGAVALALELAIMHNYVWHARWTWPDRHRKGSGVRRLVQYHALTGGTALANLGCVAVLVEAGGVPYLPASALAVCACALANFGLADMAVFTAPEVASARRTRPACGDLEAHVPVSRPLILNQPPDGAIPAIGGVMRMKRVAVWLAGRRGPGD